MKPKTFFFLLLLAAVAVGGWFAGRQGDHSPTAAKSGERKILFYQSPMHPHIKSDKPGKCTICGMNLAPVYEGETGTAATGDVLTLSPASISVVDVQTLPVMRQPLRRTLRVAQVVCLTT